MTNIWIVWVVIGLFVVYRIIALLKQKDKPWYSLPSLDPWSVMGRLSVVGLSVGMILVSRGDNNFLVAFYPVRFWCFLIVALLALIVCLGSTVQRRVAAIAGVLVFASLEVYSVLSVYPSYGWILKGYAALCLVLSVIAIARKFRTHNGPMTSPS